MKTVLQIATVLLLAGIFSLVFANSDMALHADTMSTAPSTHLSTVFAVRTITPEDSYTLRTVITSVGPCYRAGACAAEEGGR
jgi:hypothetical protein